MVQPTNVRPGIALPQPPVATDEALKVKQCGKRISEIAPPPAKKVAGCDETLIRVLQQGECILENPLEHVPLLMEVMKQGIIPSYDRTQERLYDRWITTCAPHVTSLDVQLNEKTLPTSFFLLPLCSRLGPLTLRLDLEEKGAGTWLRKLEDMTSRLSPRAVLNMVVTVLEDVEETKKELFSLIDWAVRFPPCREFELAYKTAGGYLDYAGGVADDISKKLRKGLTSSKPVFKMQIQSPVYINTPSFTCLWAHTELLEEVLKYFYSFGQASSEEKILLEQMFVQDFFLSDKLENWQLLDMTIFIIKGKKKLECSYARDRTFEEENINAVLQAVEDPSLTHGFIEIGWRENSEQPEDTQIN